MFQQNLKRQFNLFYVNPNPHVSLRCQIGNTWVNLAISCSFQFAWSNSPKKKACLTFWPYSVSLFSFLNWAVLSLSYTVRNTEDSFEWAVIHNSVAIIMYHSCVCCCLWSVWLFSVLVLQMWFADFRWRENTVELGRSRGGILTSPAWLPLARVLSCRTKFGVDKTHQAPLECLDDSHTE